MMCYSTQFSKVAHSYLSKCKKMEGFQLVPKVLCTTPLVSLLDRKMKSTRSFFILKTKALAALLSANVHIVIAHHLSQGHQNMFKGINGFVLLCPFRKYGTSQGLHSKFPIHPCQHLFRGGGTELQSTSLLTVLHGISLQHRHSASKTVDSSSNI